MSSICSYISSRLVCAGAMATGSGLLEETGVLGADARHLLQDVAQMVAEQRLGAVGVVVRYGGEDTVVLLDHQREIAGDGHAQPAYPVQVSACAQADGPDRVVPGEVAERLVERVVEHVERVEVVAVAGVLLCA